MSTSTLVSDEARTALVTAIGIILGFALAFIGQWSLMPGGWSWDHAPAIATFLIGTALLVVALFRSLQLDLARSAYRAVTKLFVAGIAVEFVGFIFAVLR